MKRIWPKLVILALLCSPAPSWAGTASIRNCTWCHGTGAQGYTVAWGIGAAGQDRAAHRTYATKTTGPQRHRRPRTAQGDRQHQRTSRRGRRPRGPRSLGRRSDPRQYRLRLGDRHPGRAHHRIRDAAAPRRRPHRGHPRRRHDRQDPRHPRDPAPVADLGPRREMALHTTITEATGYRSTSATRTARGSAAPTRTPTGFCASTSQRHRPVVLWPRHRSTTSPPNSTPDPENASAGAPPPKSSTDYSQTRPHSLQPPLESKGGSGT